jgi:hypothetical protein
MALEFVPYEAKWRDTWDEFVLRSNNGTIFHMQRFLEYHDKGKFNWHHLLCMDGGKWLGLLPAAQMGSTLESPIGASYGSFVTGDLPFGKAVDLVEAYSEYCRQNHIERTVLTAPPFIYQKNISQNIDYALAYLGFSYDKHYISHAIALKDPDFVPSFQSTARRYIHKYLREHSLQIEISTDLDTFYPILVENKKRHDVKPTHTLAELKRLQKLFPDDIVLFLAWKGKKPIAGSLVFLCNQQVSLCFYNMLLYEYEYENPIHALMYEVVKWSIEKGCSWVDIGVSQDTHAENQMTPAMSLIRFKEKFAARGILRSTFYKRFI